MALHTIEICAGVGMLGEGLRMKPIPGYEGRYSATENGEIYSHRAGRALKSSSRASSGSYLGVCLGRGNSFSVHSLVLLAFKGPPKTDQECRHLDGNAVNNRPSNLAWGSPSENSLDKNLHGTMPHGIGSKVTKFGLDVIASVRSLRADGLSYPAIQEKTGVSKSQAHRICSGQNRARG